MSPSDLSAENPYFGYPTFLDYYNFSFVRSFHGIAKREDIPSPEKHLEQLVRDYRRTLEVSSSIDFIRNELKARPNARFHPVWYWVMPETRAVVLPEDLEMLDRCGAGIPPA